MLLPRCLPAIILISQCSAFYPYHQPSLSDIPSLDTRHPHSQARSPNNNALRLPLQKLPSKSKRTNTFSIVSASIPKQTDSLAINEDGTDTSYFAIFTIGTSQKPYALLLDTAASNTWIMSSSCTTQPCEVHNTLGLSDSTSLQINTAQSFAVTYGTGSVSGDVGSDTLHSTAFSIPLTFGLATNVSTEFASYPMDGILGLGRSSLVTTTQNNVNAPTLLDVLASHSLIPAKLVGVHLWRASSGSPNNGEISFGAADPTFYSGPLTYVPALANPDGFWEVAVAGAGVDNASAAALPAGVTAILDTGTSFVLMPPAHAAALHALIPGAANPGGGETFTVPCDVGSVVRVAFAGIVVDVPPADYVGARVGGAGGSCYSNIVGRQTFNATQWLMGDVFLKNVYAVFDFDGQRVGFGTKVGDGDGGSSVVGAVSATGTAAATNGALNATVTGLGIVPSATQASGSGSVSGSASATATSSSAAGSHANLAARSGVFDVHILAMALFTLIMQWTPLGRA